MIMSLQRMIAGVQQLCSRTPADGRIEAIGVGAPGMSNMVTGTTLDLPNLPGKWANVEVKSIMEAALNLPVHMINDVKAFTIAERELGAAQGARNVVCTRSGRESAAGC